MEAAPAGYSTLSRLQLSSLLEQWIPLRTDALGVFELEVDDVSRLLNSGGQTIEALNSRFTFSSGGQCFSRGPAYYGRVSADFFEESLDLASWALCRNLPTLAVAFLEQVLNIVARCVLCRWEAADSDSPSGASYIDALLGAARVLASSVLLVLTGRAAHVNLAPVGSVANIVRLDEGAELLRYREADSIDRIIDEVGYIAQRVMLDSGATRVVVPLYGGILLGIYLDALYMVSEPPSPRPSVLYVRLGTHSLETAVACGSEGEPVPRSVMPPHRAASFAALMKNSRVLILDDNVGRGGTLTHCVELVRALGGNPMCRAAETALHLLTDPRNDIRNIVDYPSARAHYHHRYQDSMVGYVAASEGDLYASVRERHRRPVAFGADRLFEDVKQPGRWSEAQRRRVELEQNHSAAYWKGTGVKVYEHSPEWRGA